MSGMIIMCTSVARGRMTGGRFSRLVTYRHRRLRRHTRGSEDDANARDRGTLGHWEHAEWGLGGAAVGSHQGTPGHTRADQGTRTKTGMKEVVSRWADQPTGRSPNCGNCPSHNPAPLWSKSAPIVSFPRVGAGFQGADASQSALGHFACCERTQDTAV